MGPSAITGDQYFYLSLALILSTLPTVLHFARTKITRGPFFGLCGVYSILLWQLLQTGWWVKYGGLNFNAGLTLFVPPLLLGSLLTFAFDGLRTAKSYMAMVATACLAGWAFSLLRESLAAFVPLPYLIVLSNWDNLGIILAFMIAQMFGMAAYLGIRKWRYFPALPGGLLASIAVWLFIYSLLAYGFEMGMTNLANDIAAYFLSAAPVVILATAYGVLAKSRGLVMPARSLRNLLPLWKSTESDLPAGGDELTNRDQVISELRLLNQQLDTNSRLMEHHMAHASYGIVITDAGGKIMRANVPARGILANASLEGNGFDAVLNRILRTPLDFASIAIGNFPDRLRTAETAGDHDWIELIVTPLKDSDSNRITGYYLLIKDVTERIREDRRKLAENRVRDLNLAGRVLSHDFANILLGAEAQLRKLRGNIADRESLDAVGGVAGALQHAREILKQLGAGSQFGSPNLRSERIYDLLHGALDITRAAAAEAGVAIAVADERDPPMFVEADRNQLIRVFTNLIKNAIQASARGAGREIAIAVSRRGSGILVRIADRGVGLSAEQIERAFEPGFSSKGEGKGGLGLAISYLMLDAHGGHLDLEANAGGRGIVATAWLPESRDKQDFTEFRGKKLIVASTRAERIHKVIVELEQRQGCHVAEAHAEEEILALIREESGWDMLLLDDSMPLALIESRVGSLVPVRALSV